jgi:hypothetical protein
LKLPQSENKKQEILARMWCRERSIVEAEPIIHVGGNVNYHSHCGNK